MQVTATSDAEILERLLSTRHSCRGFLRDPVDDDLRFHAQERADLGVTRERARQIATRPDRGYLYSLVCLYHDTFPKPDWAPVWPEPPIHLDRAMVDVAVQETRETGGKVFENRDIRALVKFR